MDRIDHELARRRRMAIQARGNHRPPQDDLRDYRTGNGVMRIIRLGRR